MAATATLSPSAFARDIFHQIPAVEQVFVDARGTCVDIVTVLDQNDPGDLKKLFAAEAQIIDSLPDFQLSFDVILRMGRPLGEIISPKGNLLFSR